AFLLSVPRREVVKPGPRGNVRRTRAVVVAADVICVPEQRLRVEAVLGEPRGKGQPMERGVLRREPHVDRNRKTSGGAQRVRDVGEPPELIAIARRQADCRLATLLLSRVTEKA